MDSSESQFLPSYQKSTSGISLVVQWLRTCLSNQGTWVLSMVQEALMCQEPTNCMRLNWRHPHTATGGTSLSTIPRESLHTAVKTQCGQKNYKLTEEARGTIVKGGGKQCSFLQKNHFNNQMEKLKPDLETPSNTICKNQ